MTSLATSLRSLPKRQAGGPNGAVTIEVVLGNGRKLRCASDLPLERVQQLIRAVEAA